MTARSVAVLIAALNAAAVRYLVTGGLAVVAHGYVRFTADVDLVLDLDEVNLRRAIDVLRQLGYEPRAPVGIDEFLVPAKREVWIREKNLTVFSLFSSAHQATEIDVFVEPPFDFPMAFERASRQEVAPGVVATFVALDDLLAMKRRAGRPQDALDIEQLTALHEEHDDDA